VKRIITIILIVGLVGSASAEFSKVGSTGAQFLKIGVGSRYQAMGEASVATVNDVYAMFWNPAGLAEIEHGEIGFTNVNWVLDINLNYVGFAKNFDGIGTFGASATVLSMEKQEITTFEQQEGTGNYYTASSYAVGVSYARQLTTKFAFGATVKYVGEKIHLENAEGFGFDFGTMLYTGFRSLRLGMSISNMGPELKFEGPDLNVSYDPQEGQGNNSAVGASLRTSGYDMPMTFRVGMAYDMPIGPKGNLLLSAELKHPSDNAEQGSMGAEFGFADQFFLRSGYKLNYEEESFSLGGGLKANVTENTRLLIDYSWQDFGRLEATQRFSVGFTF
jgi:hypothetical protein